MNYFIFLFLLLLPQFSSFTFFFFYFYSIFLFPISVSSYNSCPFSTEMKNYLYSCLYFFSFINV